MTRDWQTWHADYDEPGSPLERRLRIVQGHVRAWVAEGEPGRRVVSACAGQGRDLAGVLPDGYPARLVELDPRNAAVAAAHAGPAVEVVVADAGLTDAYLGAVPADLVMMCGVFGNVPDGDVRRTVEALPMLCARGATVIWTRSRRAPDLTPSIREWFAETGFTERAFDAPEDVELSVGVHRFDGEPRPLVPGQVLFVFET